MAFGRCGILLCGRYAVPAAGASARPRRHHGGPPAAAWPSAPAVAAGGSCARGVSTSGVHSSVPLALGGGPRGGQRSHVAARHAVGGTGVTIARARALTTGVNAGSCRSRGEPAALVAGGFFVCCRACMCVVVVVHVCACVRQAMHAVPEGAAGQGAGLLNTLPALAGSGPVEHAGWPAAVLPSAPPPPPPTPDPDPPPSVCVPTLGPVTSRRQRQGPRSPRRPAPAPAPAMPRSGTCPELCRGGPAWTRCPTATEPPGRGTGWAGRVGACVAVWHAVR